MASQSAKNVRKAHDIPRRLWSCQDDYGVSNEVRDANWFFFTPVCQLFEGDRFTWGIGFVIDGVPQNQRL
jgi:hypothetical protein